MGYELVKKGYANEVKNCVRTSEVVVAKYTYPSAPTSVYNFSNGLFIYEHPLDNYESGVFIDLVTGEEVLPDTHFVFNGKQPDQRVVSMKSAHPFYEHFEQDLKNKGYRVDYLSEDDINYYYEKLNPAMGKELVATFE